MADNKEQPIIIIKKIIKRGGHHGGSWKVAFADFMTAMFCFFLVMWLINQSDEVKQQVSAYFKDPVAYSKNLKKGILIKGTGILQGGSPGDGSFEKAPTLEEQLRREMELLGAKLRQIINDMPGLNILKNHVEIEVTREGLRVQLIEGSDAVSFFKPGSAMLSIKGELILKTIAMELKKLSNQLVIEGHTDAADLAGREDYGNWELSADRANAARRAMSEGGLRPGQVYQVRGYADNSLRIKDNPLDPRNRRITILVLNRLLGKKNPGDDYVTPIVMTQGQ